MGGFKQEQNETQEAIAALQAATETENDETQAAIAALEATTIVEHNQSQVILTTIAAAVAATTAAVVAVGLLISTLTTQVDLTTAAVVAQDTAKVRLLDETGTPYGVKHIDNKIRVSAMPYLHDIAEGNVADHWNISADGFNPDVDIAFESLVPWGATVDGVYLFPAAGGIQMEIYSSSIEDSDAGGVNPQGTGVRTVHIDYLDADYAEQSETVTLDGTTVVLTTATDILRINGFHAVTVGTNNYAVGDIDLRAIANTPIYSRIPATHNEQHQVVWTVPAGMSAFITAWRVSVVGAKYGTFNLEATVNPEGELRSFFRSLETVLIDRAVVNTIISVPYKIPATADIKIRAKADQANTPATGLFEGWYETN